MAIQLFRLTAQPFMAAAKRHLNFHPCLTAMHCEQVNLYGSLSHIQTLIKACYSQNFDI